MEVMVTSLALSPKVAGSTPAESKAGLIFFLIKFVTVSGC